MKKFFNINKILLILMAFLIFFVGCSSKSEETDEMPTENVELTEELNEVDQIDEQIAGMSRDEMVESYLACLVSGDDEMAQRFIWPLSEEEQGISLGTYVQAQRMASQEAGYITIKETQHKVNRETDLYTTYDVTIIYTGEDGEELSEEQSLMTVVDTDNRLYISADNFLCSFEPSTEETEQIDGVLITARPVKAIYYADALVVNIQISNQSDWEVYLGESTSTEEGQNNEDIPVEDDVENIQGEDAIGNQQTIADAQDFNEENNLIAPIAFLVGYGDFVVPVDNEIENQWDELSESQAELVGSEQSEFEISYSTFMESQNVRSGQTIEVQICFPNFITEVHNMYIQNVWVEEVADTISIDYSILTPTGKGLAVDNIFVYES